jgi:glycosyltransferase involved in cell wall biosynthesis
MKVGSASILICSYNRAALLRETLAALQAMDPVADCATEIIVVDNNSTDETPAVIAQSAAAGPLPVIHLNETRQGKSFALNTGFARARGEVIALTDDDVLPAPGWLARIVADFRRLDGVSFVCGKVLPRWGSPPPPELLHPRARDLWGPLALVDYGDEPFVYEPELPGHRLPVGANVAFAAAALRIVGNWRTDLGKVNNTLIAGEDHELFVRLRRFGLFSGYYDPEVTVRHYVPPHRLTRQYFRRWNFWWGKTQALMLPDLFLELDMARVPHVKGVPRFIYRESLQQLGRWLGTLPRRDRLARMTEESRMMQLFGLVTECWRRDLRRRGAAL